MDDDFGADDVLRIMDRYQRRLTTGLAWWKDCLTEAIAMKNSSEASANMGALGESALNHTKQASLAV